MKTSRLVTFLVFLSAFATCFLPATGAYAAKKHAPSKYLTEGQNYLRAKKYDLAEASYTKAIKANHKDADALEARGILYARRSKMELAIADFSTIISINPKSDRGYIDLWAYL